MKAESDKPSCSRHCDCTVDVLRKLDDKGRTQVFKSASKIEEIGGICLAKEMTSYFESAGCVEDCGNADHCKTSCACMKAKIDSLGEQNETGAFFVRFGKDDPAVLARMDAWRAECKIGR